MDGLRKYLRIALPLLFISYLGCLIAFTHVHIVNGVTIVHSHPYETGMSFYIPYLEARELCLIAAAHEE